MRKSRWFGSAGRVLVVAVLGGALLVPFGGEASAASLYWNRVRVKTASEPACMSMAFKIASRNLGNVRRSTLEVAGSTSKAYAAITCIQTRQNAMAVVMVVSDNLPAARALSDKLAQEISRETPID